MSARSLSLNQRIRVLIADDHPVVRKMVRATLQNQPNVEICGEATNGAEAIEQARRSNPDVVVLNISMPVLNGLEAARVIRTELPRSAIVILSSKADKKFVEEARKVGVQVYVAKSKAGEALVKAVEAAVQGEDFVILE
jgi:DNA-binding NarL/FixJ family response regulator